MIKYGVQGLVVIDGYNNRYELCENVTLGDPGMFNKEAVITIPMGKENRTLVVIPERDDSVKDRVGRAVGANYLLRSYALHLHTDTECDLAIRILHEINHGNNLDSDGMYTTSKDKFHQWMWDTDYQFKDYYTTDFTTYRNILGNYRMGKGQQVQLDYLLWLNYEGNNTY
jgi:hypothetical protein